MSILKDKDKYNKNHHFGIHILYKEEIHYSIHFYNIQKYRNHYRRLPYRNYNTTYFNDIIKNILKLKKNIDSDDDVERYIS